jgi:hypothetical protein
MHPLRHVFQRAYGFLARLTLGEAREGEVEEGGGGCEPLGGACPEELAGLVEDEDGGELPLEADAAQRQPAHVGQLVHREQGRELVGVVAELHEGAGGGHGHARARGQVVERRLQPLSRDGVARRRQPVHEHAAARVEAHQPKLGEPVHFREGVRQGEERRVEVGRDAERVGERGERARRHPAGKRYSVRGTRR